MNLEKNTSGPNAVPVTMLRTGLMLALLTVAVPLYATAAAEPLALVHTLVDQALTTLRDSELPQADKRQKLKGLVEANFDFRDMSRSALGPHWNELSDQQRTDYAKAFQEFIEDVYLSKIRDYAGQDIRVQRSAEDGPEYAQVYTQVIKNEDNPIELDFRLKHEAEGWRVYDVTIDEISITANYRTQFSHVIANQGFDHLMEVLRAKTRKLDATVGSR